MSDHTGNLTIWQQWQALGALWTARMHRHFGILNHNTGEFLVAIFYYDRALEINRSLSRAYLERGILYWRELNESRRAIVDLNTALRLRPGWPEALFCRGLAHQTAGNLGMALDDFEAYLDSGDRVWQDMASRQVQLIRMMQEGSASSASGGTDS
jgi:tetratricopeptide (TPR) repeat protein